MRTVFKKCFTTLLAGLMIGQLLVVSVYAEIPAQSAREELSRWVVGTGAILNVRSGLHHRSFEGERHEQRVDPRAQNLYERLYEQDPEIAAFYRASVIDGAAQLNDMAFVRRALEGSWNIRSAEDLERQIANLLEGRGHSRQFMESYEVFSAALVEFADFDEAYGLDEELVLERFLMYFIEQSFDVEAVGLVESILYFGEKWGDRGIAAWDWVRVGTLVNMGYIAEFISHEEGIRLMEPASNLLKLHFSDWDEVIDNYMDGYVYWARAGGTAAVTVNLEVVRRRLDFHRLRLDYLRLGDNDLNPFNDDFFDRTPIVNLERTIRLTQELLLGYWYLENEWNNVEHYFNVDGSFISVFDRADGTSMKLTGAYRIDDRGALRLRHYNMDTGDGLRPIDDDQVRLLGSFGFLTSDGNNLVNISVFNGQPSIATRSEGTLIESFGQR
ncbi:MAG: DUF1266 domain-containing protein [Defluviitaleaceae bacterium]|nr:DUF1266 domain-containing protein [Defluviitaleaceae bacterium]